tara:strand:+ start:576 stop:938 length:363 start_codon:yes stop_codon:yes gene_type:complete
MPRREKDTASRIAEIERDIVSQDLHVSEEDVVPTNGASAAIVEVEPELSEETLAEVSRLESRIAALQDKSNNLSAGLQEFIAGLQKQVEAREKEVEEERGSLNIEILELFGAVKYLKNQL